MKFAEKENINLLETTKSKITFCNLRYCFPQAPLYPTGWFDEGRVFEINEFEGDLNQELKLLMNELGMVPPKRIQFKAVPSHITAVALFDSYFKCEFQFVTSWYPYFDFTTSNLEQLIKKFQENCDISISPTTYQYYSEIIVECTVGLIQHLLLSFWLLKNDDETKV